MSAPKKSKGETSLYQPIIDALAISRLALVVRVQSGKVQVKRGWMQLAPKGTPDLIGFALADGRIVALEVKVPGEQPKPEQQAYIDAVRKAGGIAGAVESPKQAIDLLRWAAAGE